jgi:hypothetical protein
MSLHIYKYEERDVQINHINRAKPQPLALIFK